MSDVASYLPDHGTIIELGCGPGLMSNYLALKLKNIKVIGLDLDENKIKIAKTTRKDRTNIDFMVKDACLGMLPSAGVIMTDFLHHLPKSEHSTLLDVIYKNLEKDGRLVILEVDPSIKPAWKYWITYLSDIIFYPFSERCNFRHPSVSI